MGKQAVVSRVLLLDDGLVAFAFDNELIFFASQVSASSMRALGRAETAGSTAILFSQLFS